MEHAKNHYFVPAYSKLPFLGALGMFCLGYGTLNLMHADIIGTVFFLLGSLVIAGVMFFWFREVIHEYQAGLYNDQIGRSFRWGMIWFIFAEICFFGIFFGALFYARLITVPALAGLGEGQNVLTHIMLWPNFNDIWPLLKNPNPASFPGSMYAFDTWSIPALNTLVLLSSAVTITWAHWSLKRNARTKLVIGMILTIVLGVLFLVLQANQFLLANNSYGLKMSSGIYGSTFFMLVGFHAAHVLVGLIILIAILFRVLRGHFTPDEHFGFEASVWYWNFIDIVWLFLFIFVYWI